MTPTTYQALHDVAREWADDMNARANVADAARVERVAGIRRALDAVMAGEGPPGALSRAEAAWEAEQASAVREGDAFFAEGFAIGLVLQGAYRAALGHALAMLSRGRALRRNHARCRAPGRRGHGRC